MPDAPALVLLATVAALLGTLGGLGGSLFLVPVLIVLGVEPAVAAPLGAMGVAAGSVAAAPTQLGEGLVHHRLGVSVEVVATVGAIGGALAGDVVPSSVIARALGAAALVAAVLTARRTPVHNPPDPLFAGEPAGEWPGTLSGAYRLGDEVVPYQARRVPTGLAAMLVAGVLAGLGGVGGGFIKVPAMREIMRVPIKVAAATSTFTVGITAAVSLLVFSRQGRLDAAAGVAVVVGAVAGGVLGARVQRRLAPGPTRKVLAGLLLVVAVVLLVRG